jgi:hypothetical protein
MHKIFHIRIFLTIFLLLGACSGKTTTENAQPTPDNDTVKVSREIRNFDKWNHIASFIAGDSLPVNNDFYVFTKNEEWEKYHLRMDSLWREFEEKTHSIKTFQQAYLPAGDAPDTIFYPFSGPDIPYAMLFYPEASYYFLFALEPVGTILPSSNQIETHPMKEMYNAYFESVSLLLSAGFFRTNDLEKEVSGSTMDGVLPILLMLLKRMDYDILSVSTGGKDNEDICPDNTLVTDRSIEIEFCKNNEPPKKLCYVSCNLSNRGISRDTTLQKILNRRDFGVLVKSASYLMHNNGFSRIKKLLINRASIIVQDDSGIPFSAFSSNLWDIHLYGHYSKPIFLFRRYFQQELANTHKDTSLIRPMNFRVGYGEDYNLLIAKKK